MSPTPPTWLDKYFGTGYVFVSYLGALLPPETIIDFEGPGVTVVDSPGTGATRVTISGGTSATTTTTANVTVPAILGTVSIPVTSTSSLAAGLGVFIAGGGYYLVQSVTDGTHFVGQNLGLSGNAAPGATIFSGSLVIPVALSPSGPSQVPNRVSTTQVLDGTKANIYANTSGGAITITMPPTAALFDGYAMSFKDDHLSWGTNALTVAANTAQQIQDPTAFSYASTAILGVTGAQQGFQWDNTQAIWLAF